MNDKLIMTTPEQLTKWAEGFEEWFSTQLTVAGIPRRIQQAFALHGYLHAKQETEQAIKDARKQVLEEVYNLCEAVEIDTDTPSGKRAAAKCVNEILKLRELLK